jgi:hypothetical protein
MDGWMDGWLGVKAVLRIAYSNQKCKNNLIKSVTKFNFGALAMFFEIVEEMFFPKF